MDETTATRHGNRPSALTVGLVAVLALASAGALAGPTSAQTSTEDELTVTVDRWCPPQLEGCLQPTDACATYAEPGRWMGVDLTVEDGDGPASFAEVTLSYTNATGPQEKTEATDSQGEVSFSLRDAEDVSVQAHRPSDGATGSLELAPTWGEVQITHEGPALEGTVGEPVPVNVSYTVEGHGPGGTPDGTVTVTAPEHRSATLDAADGRLTGTVVDRVAGTAEYRASGGDVCGLPLGGGAFTLEWNPGPPVELSVDCEDDAIGNTAFDCTAQGQDRFENPVEPADATWTADPARSDANTGFIDASGPEATYLPHVRGGWVTITATVGELSAEERLHVGPEIVSITPDPIADEPIEIELFDPDGLREARVLYGGQVLDELENLDGETATLSAEFRAGGEYSLRIEAVDGQGNLVPIEPIEVEVAEAHIAPGTGSSSGSASSTSSSSGTSTGTSPTDTTGEPPSTVQAEPVGDGRLEAEVDLVDGRTPTVEAPGEALSVELLSSTHTELVVGLQPRASAPSPAPGYTLRTVDVSAATTAGHEATIDEARLTVGVPGDEIADRDLSAEDLALFHWTNGRWEQVDATLAETGEAVELTGTVTSLSPFAVAAPEAPEGQRLEIAREGPSRDLPLTYRGQVETTEIGETVRAATSDGALSFSVDLANPGEHVLVVEIRSAPSEGMPEPVTADGRYVDVTITGPDGTERDLADARDVSYTLRVDELPGDGSNLVPVTVERDAWSALPGSLVREDGNVTVQAESREPLMGVLADRQAPRIGLQDPLPATLAGEVEITAVASDNLAIDRVRVLAEGAVLDEADERPFTFTLRSADLGEGTAELRFEAVDKAGNVGETTRTVQVQPEPLDESALEEPAADGETSDERQDTPTPGFLGLALAAGVALAAHRRGRRGPS